MTSLDPYTEHWISEGGRDSAGQVAWSDLHDSDAIKSEHGPTRQDHVNDDLDADVRQAVAETKSRDVDREDWDESREHREWLGSRYPDSTLDTYAKGMLDWNRKFQTDPYSAKEEWVRTWARMPPFHHTSKSAAAKAGVPEGTPERWRGDWERDLDVKAAYRAAVADKNDRDGFVSTAELRQRVKQETGLSLSQFLDVCKQIDEASATDAASIANRFAQFSGAPATEAQAAELQHQANAGARVDAAQTLVNHVVQSGALPGLGRPEIDNAVANVLQDPNFPRSGDHVLDLRNAHDIALKQLAAGHTAAPAPSAAQREAAEVVAWGQANLANYDRLEPVIADVLSHADFPRADGDNALYDDLRHAHAMASRIALGGHQGAPQLDRLFAQGWAEVQKGKDAQVQREAVKKAKHARSISGSPSPGASSGGQRWDNSIEDDARAAYRSASGSV